MMTISEAKIADRLYQAADLLTCLSDLMSARNARGEIMLSDAGASGLNNILMCVARHAMDGADELEATRAGSRQSVTAEYERGFQNGVAAGRQQVNATVAPQPQGKTHIVDGGDAISEILRNATSRASASDVRAPVPELTELTEQDDQQGAVKRA